MMLTEMTTVPGAALPVQAFKDHLRLGTGFSDDGMQDGLIEAYLRAAIAAIEGRIGKVLIARRWEGHVFSLQARHSLRLGSRSRGSAEAGWSFPLVGKLKGQVQLFSGYGESLIDYNLRQTRLGIGLSMIDWL